VPRRHDFVNGAHALTRWGFGVNVGLNEVHMLSGIPISGQVCSEILKNRPVCVVLHTVHMYSV
jgi:hypothetical protein